MSGIDVVPSPHSANRTEIGDFIELECLRRVDANVSALDIAKIMERQSDRLTQESILQNVHNSIADLEARIDNIGSKGALYPFTVDAKGEVIQYRKDFDENHRVLYLFLLLCTRMNMKNDRKHASHDAAVLFEQLCREVSIRLWGGIGDDRVNAIVFGTVAWCRIVPT